MTAKKTIAIDFDGVINPYAKGWQGIGIYELPTEECKAAINQLSKKYCIVIHTARVISEHPKIKRYLAKHKIEFDKIFSASGDRAKPKADIYIDDRAICFDGSWARLLSGIEKHPRMLQKASIGDDQVQQHNQEFVRLSDKMVATKIDGTARYGTKAWNSLGPKGVFVDINRKFQRVKHFVWENNRQTTSENIEDTLLDLSVYCLLMVMSLRREVESSSKYATTTPRPK